MRFRLTGVFIQVEPILTRALAPESQDPSASGNPSDTNADVVANPKPSHPKEMIDIARSVFA